MSYGQRMKEARKKAGLTQEQLAKECGFATITIRQYEACKREPRIAQFKQIAEALDVDINWLMHGKTLEQRDQELKNEVDGKFDRIEKLAQIKQIYERLNVDGKLEVGELFINSTDSKHIDYVINHMKKLAAVPQYQIAPKR